MGDSGCLMHGFSYASAIPNQSKQGNPMRALGESVSFGRFLSESEPLSWEKWSTFSHKKYVEEAARYAQPGSVAQKKAFFDAHYKKIAAQKAAAAALLEQENAARAQAERDLENSAAAADECGGEKQVVILNYAVDEGSDQRISVSLSENLGTPSCSEGNGTPQMEKPLLKESCVGSKKSGLSSSLKSSIRRKTWKLPSSPTKPVTPHFKKENNVSQFAKKYSLQSMDKKRSSPKSVKDRDKAPVSVSKKAASSGLTPCFSRTPKDCRTPTMAVAKGVARYSALTPQSENRRMKTSADSSDIGSKTAGPKWHILSTGCKKSLTACRNTLQSPASSTPFALRTEERAAKRKQKLEEKFNMNEEKKGQKTLKEKAGNEIKKLSYGFCFKARPLPDFYKERETSINQMKKTPVPWPQSRTVELGRSNSKKQHGTVSMPTPPSTKSFTKNPSKTNATNPSRSSQRITHKNKSPNILHPTGFVRNALSHKTKLR